MCVRTQAGVEVFLSSEMVFLLATEQCLLLTRSEHSSATFVRFQVAKVQVKIFIEVLQVVAVTLGFSA